MVSHSFRSACLILGILLLATSPIFGDTQIDVQTHLRITTATRGSAPVISGDQILFSYRPDLPVRHVGISFSHESYSRIHDLERNANGVYVLTYLPTAGTDELLYRFVVDGLWMTDPENPMKRTDVNGVELSYFGFPGVFPVIPASPVITRGGRVDLYLAAESGRRVYVTGDFANWDPFMYRLKETEPGVYRFSIALPPGRHWYQYVIDGFHTTDPLNPATAVRGDGRPVSVMYIEG